MKLKLDFLIISILVVLNLFLLPSSGFWLIHPQGSNVLGSSEEKLGQYQHPLIPVVKPDKNPEIQAQNYILIDNDTNTVLLSKNPHDKVYPASITKLATALTALNIYPLDEVVTVNQTYTEGQVMDLKVGENITIRSLISALLVHSANDAAFNLANHHPQGIVGFVSQMNSMTQKYGLTGTKFVNFDGIHNSEHYSTVYDLAELSRIAIKNPIIKSTVKNKKITVADVDNKEIRILDSTNELLDIVSEVEGLKTGWTPEAGGCFVGLININGHYLISVVAQSPDRFSDTRKIIDWSKQNISWQPYSL
jgi:D-alanyl-D-alanine carboxypeptidase (penicillin-binding protein 5/6)